MCSDKQKGIFTAAVKSNRKIGEGFYKILLEFRGKAAAAFADTEPGQFAELDLRAAPIPDKQNLSAEMKDKLDRNIFLRRPFSFSGIENTGDTTLVEILYCAVGPSSLRMSLLEENDKISVTGPLGSGFKIKEDKPNALLLVGGMGAGPIQHLAKTIKENHPHIKQTIFTGARSLNRLPFEGIGENIKPGIGKWIKEFAAIGLGSLVCTNDGTAGFKGYVTEGFENYLKNNEINPQNTVIYTCGPEPMLREVSRMADERNIDCQISMERNMGCGLGICQSCAVKCRDGSGDFIYKLCCKDGPVFDSKEVIFE